MINDSWGIFATSSGRGSLFSNWGGRTLALGIGDRGGRRSGIDRRQFSYSMHIPERRGDVERRSCVDRRMDRERRSNVDRRSGADRRYAFHLCVNL
jgi:hypothetical protein